MMLKVAMIARSTLFTIHGGDTVQIIQTAKYLEQLGVQADVKLTDDVIDYEQYDLLHFFNIIRPADMLIHIKRSKKPYVVSTILVDYSEFEKYHRRGIMGILFHFLPSDTIEYLKTVARRLLGRDKLMTHSFLWKGQRRSIREVLKKASVLLPNSESEYERVSQRYHCHTGHISVPNGIDPRLFQYDMPVEKDALLVICVARIEGRKNQLNLIRALNATNYTLLLIGSPAPNQLSYYKACRAAAAENIFFIKEVPQHELLKYYRKAKVHALPSWFETTGLSSLEAGVMGCNIVITEKGDTKEYFGDHASYCDPGSVASIYQAVKMAAGKTHDDSLRQEILANYTWQQAAAKTMDAYQRTMNTV